jgi:hypothetical protein
MHLALSFTLFTLLCLVSFMWLQLLNQARQKNVLRAKVRTERIEFGN